jgi:hypothetical protein
MPFEQLRALVVSTVEGEDPDASVDLHDLAELADPRDAAEAAAAVAEFETRPTTCLPHARVSTLDQLIAALDLYEPRFSRGSSPCLQMPPNPAVRASLIAPRPVPPPPRPATEVTAAIRRPREIRRSPSGSGGRGTPRR